MDQEITISKLFERLVILETKFDSKTERDDRVTRRFTKWAVAIFFAELVNILIHLKDLI